MSIPVQYDKYIHRHNFASWAAARAAQRGFADVNTLKSALEASDIKDFVLEPCGPGGFDDCHKEWCHQIRNYLKEAGIRKATYGRAAKLVNVYLKSMVVLRDLDSEEASYIHPPIDRILLQNVADSLNDNHRDKAHLRKTSWTKLTEKEYFDLLERLRGINGDQPFWRLEEHWSVTKKAAGNQT